jgi:cellulose synthase/poly-beta-1,6-N-acetylglucosamine synthase-like glycosyltransferase
MFLFNKAVIEALELASHVVFLVFALCLQVMFIAGLVAIWKRHRASRRATKPANTHTDSASLPYVTTMLAVYDEAECLERNCVWFARVHYPKDLCELLILTEEDDAKTNAVAVRMAGIYPNVRHEIVPADYLGADHPHNKPRALAYGLTKLHDRTEVVGVLDAEDLVSADVLSEVSKYIGEYPIVQGRLAIRNSRENLLTYWFGCEYALLEVLQSGRDLLGWMKIPRGTTYFVRRELIEKIGWSTRNVTEDLAFNVRVYASGYEARLIESTTWEESPLEVGVWIKQRTRWFQGAFQTIRENIDLSRLNFIQRFSVQQLVYHILVIPLFGAVMLPLFIYDSLFAVAFSLPSIISTSDVYEPLWFLNTICLGLVCAEFATAVILRYRNHPDLIARLVSCLLLPLMFMFLLPLPAVRACWREWRGSREWEKTRHRGETCDPETLVVPGVVVEAKAAKETLPAA